MNWFYSKDGQQVGPVDFSEIERLQAEGQLTGESLVWQQGSPNWVKLSSLVASSSVLSSEPVPPPLTTTSANNPLAIASLALSILGLLCCGVGLVVDVAAVVCGHIALKQIKTKGGGGQGLAKAGLIIGYIAIAVHVIVSILYIVAAATGAIDANGHMR
jgi:hypothetical protein